MKKFISLQKLGKLFFLQLLFLTCLNSFSQAPLNFYWVNDLGDNDWRKSGNWSSTSGGAGNTVLGGSGTPIYPGQGVATSGPPTNHIAIFDGAGANGNSNCNLNTGTGLRIGGLYMIPGYNSTVDIQIEKFLVAEDLSGALMDPAYKFEIKSGILNGTTLFPSGLFYNHLITVPFLLEAPGEYRLPLSTWFRMDVDIVDPSQYNITANNHQRTVMNRRSAATGIVDLYIDQVIFNELEFYGAGPSSGGFQYELHGSECFVTGDWISTNAAHLVTNDGIMHIEKDIIVNNSNISGLGNTGAANINYHGSALLLIDGTSAQTIDHNSIMYGGPLPHVKVDKPAGSLFVSGTPTIQGNLELVNGILYPLSSSATDFIILNTASQVTGASDLSFCDGAIAKIGVADFIYPVGKNNEYHPVKFTNTINPTPNRYRDGYKVEYFESPATTLTTNSPLAGVQNCEYWKTEAFISSAATSLSSQVQLSYRLSNNCNPSFFDEPCILRVAELDASVSANWDDRGNGNAGSSIVITDGTLQNHEMVLSASSLTFPITNEVDLTFGQVDPVVASVTSVTDATCGMSDGEIIVSASGGVSPYQYSIDCGSPSPSYQSSPVFSGLAAGTYVVCVLDANGCQIDVATVTVNETSCCFAATDPLYQHFDSDILGTPGVFSVTSGLIVFPNKVFVDQVITVTNATLDISNCDVVFDSDAGIILGTGAALIANNSTLRGCGSVETWLGMEFTDNSTGTVNENVIQNAAVGLKLHTNSPVEISNNEFYNNEKGIVISPSPSFTADYTITGNTLVWNGNDQWPVTNTSLPATLMGITIQSVSMSGIISQNDFTFNSTTNPNGDAITGINVLDAGIHASENAFSNIETPYLHTNGNFGSSFENNEIEYNAAIPFSNVVAITVDNVSGPLLIKGNEIRNVVNASLGTEAGIWAGNCLSLIVTENTIDDFMTGINLRSSSGEISENKINNAYDGIATQTSSGLSILNNGIEGSTHMGISMINTGININVEGNSINNDINTSLTTGIYFEINSAAYYSAIPSVRFVRNCIFNSRTAMGFRNISALSCLTLPFIQENYLYDYMVGIRVQSWSGNIGTCAGVGFAGRNSFHSNWDSSAWLDVQNISPGCGTITLQGNFPVVLALSAGVTNTFPGICPGEDFTSACGSEARSLMMYEETVQNFLLEKYPLEFNSGTFSLNSSYLAYLQSRNIEEYYENALGLLAVLLSNPTTAEAEAFVSEIAAYGILDPSDVKQLQFSLEASTGNLTNALTTLNSFTAISNAESDWVSLYNTIINLYQNNEDFSALTDIQITTLLQIDVNRNNNAPLARNMINGKKGHHEYIYEEIRSDDTYSDPIGITPDLNEMVIYPNPASGEISISFSVAQTENSFLEIYDMRGRLVYSDDLPFGGGTLQLNISSFNSGVYSVVIKNETGFHTTQRFVKE